MHSSKRSSSWKKVVREHGPAFVEWIDANGVRFRLFDKLALDLERYLLDVLHACTCSEVGEQQCYEEFVEAIPSVLARCDEDIYDQPLVAEAYAYVHLLERYRRFWSVLVELTKRGILPMRDSGVEVLDVGTGPAPTLFAVEDFYRALREYSSAMAIPVLGTPPPRVHSVESSYAMVHLTRDLAKHAGRPKPFEEMFREFEGLDLREARLLFRDELQRRLDDELGWMSYPVLEGDWQGKYRYSLVIFSNFLTEFEKVAELERSIRDVFYGLRAGGIVVVVGGYKDHYPQIYATVEKLAKESGIQIMSRVPPVIPCNYSDVFADRIKQTYAKVWRYLEKHFTSVEHWKETIPRDLRDAEVPLKGPTQFGLRVFRKVWASPRRSGQRA